MQVEITDRAARSLGDILLWLEEIYSYKLAQQVEDEVMNRVRGLALHPEAYQAFTSPKWGLVQRMQ